MFDKDVEIALGPAREKLTVGFTPASTCLLMVRGLLCWLSGIQSTTRHFDLPAPYPVVALRKVGTHPDGMD